MGLLDRVKGLFRTTPAKKSEYVDPTRGTWVPLSGILVPFADYCEVLFMRDRIENTRCLECRKELLDLMEG